MREIKTVKQHYKMYKQGRFWVFAGITVATIGLSPLVGHAATATEQAPATPDTTTTTDQAEQPATVTLMPAKTQATNVTTPVTAQNDSGNKTDESTAEIAAQKDDSQATGDNADENVTAAPETQTDDGQSVVSGVENGTTSETKSSDGQSVTTGNDEVTTPEIDGVDGQAVTSTDGNPTTTTTILTAPTTPKATARAVEAAEPTIKYSGTHNTAPWTIDTNGVLTIYAGTLGDIMTAGDTWYSYRAEITKVIFDGKVIAGNSLNYAFFNNSSDARKPITEIVGLENLDTSHTTEMAQMFSGDQVADFSGLENWDVSHVTTFYAMFGGNQAVKSIDLSRWDVSNVETLGTMFQGDSALTTVNLSGWADKVGKVREASSFLGNTNVETLDLSGWNLSNLERAKSMFGNNPNLKSINLTGVKAPKLVQTWSMFEGDSQLEALDLSGFDMTAVTNMSDMLNVADEDNGTFKLKSLTLGVKTTINDAGLPAIVKTARYTGKWVNQADPTGSAYTSAELMALYNGTTNPDETITWVWQENENLAALVGQDVSVKMGSQPDWQVSYAVDQTKTLNSAGQPLTAEELKTITATGLDLNQAGPQTVTLTYIDGFDVTHTTTVTVTMVATQAEVTVKDSQVVMGPNASWNLLDHVTGVTDFDGNAVDADQWADLDLKVTTAPDLTKEGPQQITVTYVDALGNLVTTTTTVTVVKSGATISAKQPQIVWPSDASKLTVSDLVDQVTDADGQAITDLSGVTMSAIDPTKAGAQLVTLSYTDAVGNVVTTTATVTVDQATVTTQPTEVVAGPTASWDYQTSLTGVTDGNGQAIDVKNADIKVVTGPDLSVDRIGQPQTVVLTYTDNLGQTQTVNVTVTTTKTQAQLTGRPVTVIAGPQTTWTLADSLDLTASFAADGTALTTDALHQITSDTTPNVQQPGTYELTLRYVDAAGNLITTTTVVTVVASQASLNVQDQQITAGTTWDASQGFVSGTDATGQALTFNDLTVTGNVDSNTPGQYQLTYHYTDIVGNVLTKTVTVTVVAAPTDPDDGDGDDTNPGTDPGDGDEVNPGTDPDENGNEQPGTDHGSNGDGGATTPDGTDSQPSGSTNGQSAQGAGQATVTPAQAALRTIPAATTKSAVLPQTDETHTATSALGVTLLGLTGLLGGLGLSRRRRRDQ